MGEIPLINGNPKFVRFKTNILVEKDNTGVNSSIVNIVEGWFSFLSWGGGGWLTGALNLCGLKPTFEVEKVNSAVKS